MIAGYLINGESMARLNGENGSLLLASLLLMGVAIALIVSGLRKRDH